ncbi:hypothetical protein FQZ97_1021040 [compost metagenome]
MDFLVRQRRRRLIHDHDTGIDRQRAGDRHHLLLGNAEIAQPDRRIEIGTGAMQERARIRVQFLPVDQAETIARGMTEEDVFGDGQFVEQHGFLVNGGHACSCSG